MTRFPFAPLALLTLVLSGLVSCKSSPKPGLPKNLPKINVQSSAAPPRHNMNRGEYPFDERGNYVAAWAAEGSRGGGNIPAPQKSFETEKPVKESRSARRKREAAERTAAQTAYVQYVQLTSTPSPTPTSRMVVSSAPTNPPRPPITSSSRPPNPKPTPAPTVRISSTSSTPVKKPTASTTKPKPKPKTPAKPTSSTLSYTVKSGDTLYGLALRHKSSVAKIKSATGISSDNLKIGQKLKIPR